MTREQAYRARLRANPRPMTYYAATLRARISEPTAAGCTEWTGARTRKGYGKVTINGSPMNAHRAVWLLVNGPIPAGLVVCHRCDNPACCNVEHLFLGTIAENTADMVAKGRQVTRAKITGEMVREIRRRRAAGEPYLSIARDFGITRGHARNVAVGLSWSKA